MRAIAFLNRKGGVGKTSTVYHLAGTLAKDGHRVLAIDADPQANLTAGFLGPDVSRELPASTTIAALFDPAQDPFPESLILPSGIPRLSIVPGSAHLDTHNKPDPHEPGPHHRALRVFLNDIQSDFDLAMIDCPPTIYRASWAALAASGFVVVPLQPEDFGSQGIVSIQEAITSVRTMCNPALALAGYLLTMHNKALGVHGAYETRLRQLYGRQVFATCVPLAKDFKESVTVRKPIVSYKPRSAAAKAIQALADELITRIDNRTTVDTDWRVA
jgi:chromosome partitioning protein